MAEPNAKMWNEQRKIIYLDSYVPLTSWSIARMEQLMKYRLDYFASRFRALFRAYVQEPERWDSKWVLGMLDLESVCRVSFFLIILISF
jgi:hypothetical protein